MKTILIIIIAVMLSWSNSNAQEQTLPKIERQIVLELFQQFNIKVETLSTLNKRTQRVRYTYIAHLPGSQFNLYQELPWLYDECKDYVYTKYRNTLYKINLRTKQLIKRKIKS